MSKKEEGVKGDGPAMSAVGVRGGQAANVAKSAKMYSKV